VTRDLWLIDSVAASLTDEQINLLLADPTIVSITEDERVEAASTVEPLDYVEPTDNFAVWDVLDPVSIEVGANLLHNPTTAGVAPITGAGVTVAVVDSGVAFSNLMMGVQQNWGYKAFLGQIDFVNGHYLCSRPPCWQEQEDSISQFSDCP